MAKKKAPKPVSIINRRARHDYEFKNTIIAGLVLSGAETKSLRSGHGQLSGAYVNIKDGELWLNNAKINPLSTNQNNLDEEMQMRNRKLLVKKRELQDLQSAKEQGLTIIPVKVLTKGRYIKIEIATARGLKKYDKREKLKKRDVERDIKRTFKS